MVTWAPKGLNNLYRDGETVSKLNVPCREVCAPAKAPSKTLKNLSSDLSSLAALAV